MVRYIIRAVLSIFLTTFCGSLAMHLIKKALKKEKGKMKITFKFLVYSTIALVIIFFMFNDELLNKNKDSGDIIILPLEEKHTDPVLVSIESELGGTLYYTLDGSNPKASDTAKIYSEPFWIDESVTVGVSRRFENSWSNVASRRYDIELSKGEREKLYLLQMEDYIQNGMYVQAKEIAMGMVLKDNADALCNLGYLHMLDAENSEVENDNSLYMAEQCFLRSIELGNQQAEVNLLSMYLTHWYPFQSIADVLNQCINDVNTVVIGYLREVFPEKDVEALTLSADDIRAFYSFEFTGMVMTSGYPTDTWKERYEFVRFNWDDPTSRAPKKYWNHYVQTPLYVDILPVGFCFVEQ